MKPAHLFVEAISQGLSPIEALHCLPNYEPLYIHKVPVDVHRAALRKGWRFFPVSSSKHLAVTRANLSQATDDLQQLRYWARQSPNWALVTGPDSGVFVLEVDGEAGLDTLLDFCGDDWSWLDTLRSMAGEKRYLYFAWPEGWSRISNIRQIGEGLSVRGEGEWVFVPPSRGPHGVQYDSLNPGAEAVSAPRWLLECAFKLADKFDPSRPFPRSSVVRDAWCSVDLAEFTHDQV